MTVYDAFTYFNELDVLEIRLHELAEVVDRFVLVEAARTFSGQPKPLFFDEVRRSPHLAPFLPRITRIVVDDLPGPDASPWQREAFQRNAILRGLGDAEPDDVVLIGDVDEIPRAAALRHFLDVRGEAACFWMPLYYYRLNCRNVAGAAHDPLTVAIRRRFLRTPQETRLERFHLPGIADAGWHFSYLGNEQAIRRKIEAFSHQEFNTPEFTADGVIERRVAAGEDLFGRGEFRWAYVPLDGSFPAYVSENRERFAALIDADAAGKPTPK